MESLPEAESSGDKWTASFETELRVCLPAVQLCKNPGAAQRKWEIWELLLLRYVGFKKLLSCLFHVNQTKCGEEQGFWGEKLLLRAQSISAGLGSAPYLLAE